MNFAINISFVLIAVSSCRGQTPASVQTADPAQRILEATGVKGGLVVHLGCTTGRLTAALHANKSYIVHGLAADKNDVKNARRLIRARGLYGPVSAEYLHRCHLPYADGVVDLVVAPNGTNVAMDEIMRVLSPRGVAYIRQENGPWVKKVKPRPGGIDSWSHYLHSPDGNQVAKDTRVAPPHHIKWQAKPFWNRHHRHGNKTAMVSEGGRIFYISDEVPPLY